jgi:predicted kinase
VATLLLMCGLPGSGKTTLARQLAPRVPAVRLCPDEWMSDLAVDLFDEPLRERLETRFWLLARELLTLGQSVILESGFWLRADRDEKRTWARAHGIRVELYLLDPPFEELCRRVTTRTGGVPLTPAHLHGYRPFFQTPDAAERALFDPCAYA